MKNYFVKYVLWFLSLALWNSSLYGKESLIIGVGSSAIAPVMYQWAESYFKETGIKINYQSMGSGAGIKQTIEKVVDFGASDVPLSSVFLRKNHIKQIPAIFGGIVPVVNIPGIKSGDLVLNGDVLAEIYLGKIRRWNDPKIKKLNPKRALPDEDIFVVYRADGSGTTFNFTEFLSESSPEWLQRVGKGTNVRWSDDIEGVGGKGNTGVLQIVSRLKYSIGYVEYPYALQAKVTWVKMFNKEGFLITPNDFSFKSAISHISWSKENDFNVMANNMSGKNSWPIMATTFLLFAENISQGNQTLFAFLKWCFTKGTKNTLKLDYVPLSEELFGLVESFLQERGNG